MLLSATLSKPAKNVNEILGNDFLRVKIKLSAASTAEAVYFVELYTQKQVFHKKMSGAEAEAFISAHAGKTFKNCVQRTETEEITTLANKKGEITTLTKKIKTAGGEAASGIEGAPKGVAAGNEGESRSPGKPGPAPCGGRRPSPLENLLNAQTAHFNQLSGLNKKKNYLLPEGKPVPFLVRLGIMTAQGKVIASKYDKFRQINRFLEIFNDVLPEVMAGKKEGEPLSVVDFGSGKSYLTFAVQYFLTEIKKIDCQVFGLDLKKDVIEYCSRLAGELGLTNLNFAVGDIAAFGEDKKPDVIITLHACDTATDYALNYAVKHGARAILSVPCCQHEINLQLKKSSVEAGDGLSGLLKYGLIKERFSALVTDALRGELLEKQGYKVQMLEFIDDAGTPKNLMIRAVKGEAASKSKENGSDKAPVSGEALLKKLGVTQTLKELLVNH